MSCNKFKREVCIATGEKEPGHIRRYCKKCRTVYQKKYRDKVMAIYREYKDAN